MSISLGQSHFAPTSPTSTLTSHSRPARAIQGEALVPREDAAPASAAETELLQGYLSAIQRKALSQQPGFVRVPPQSRLGQWLEHYRAQVQHPLVQTWMREQKIDPSAIFTIVPAKGTLSVEIEGKTKVFSLNDNSGWGQISGPLLSAAKVISPGTNSELRARFGESYVQVSAKVVANFQGEPLPANLAEARTQIRRLEHNKAFDPIPPDDRVRPAASRSTQALELQKQNAARFYTTAPEALAYKKLAINVADNLPNTRAEAKKWAEAMIFKLTGKQVDADTLYLNRFKNASTPLTPETATATGWEHTQEEPYSSMRLPDALLKNFSEHDGVPGNLDLEAGLYTDGPGQSQKAGYGAHNQFPLAPSAVMHESWKTDFQTQMTQKIDNFWTTQTDDYETAIKGEFAYQARTQLKATQARTPAEQKLQAPEHRFTREDYRLVMGAVPNLVQDENAALTVEQLKTKAPPVSSTQAYALTIKGFASNDIIRFSAPNSDRQVLYIPGAQPAFLRFDSLQKLDQWVVEQTKTPQKREALLTHFPLVYQQDHEAGFIAHAAKFLMPVLWFTHVDEPKEGLNSLFDKLASGELKGPTIDESHASIKGDVFATLATATKERMKSDADVVIKSNSEVIRDTWLNDITVAAGLLVKLAPIGAPVAAIAAATGLTELALGLEKESSGDTQAERKDGSAEAFDGLLNTLFSATAVGSGEDPFTLPEDTPPPSVAGETTSSGTPDVLPANRLQPSQAGNISGYAVPEGEQLIANVTPNAKGIFQVKDASGADHWYIRYTDTTGVRSVYEIKSNFKLSNDYLQIIDRDTGKPVMTVHADGNGEWTRAPGDGGVWWKREFPTTPNVDPVKQRQLSDEFLDVNGEKMKGAEILDNHFKLDGNEYTYGVAFNDDGETIPQISWTSEENPANATPRPTASVSTFGTSRYSEQFIKDIHRSKFTIERPDGTKLELDIGGEINTLARKKGTILSDIEVNGLIQENIEALEKFIPDPALRRRISEVANQWALGAAPDEFATTRFKGTAFGSGRDPHYYINYDPKGNVTTVTAKSDFIINNLDPDTGEITPLTDLSVKASRTFTIRESNELDSDGFTVDPSSPTRIEVRPILS